MKTFIKKPHKIKLASFNLLTKNNNNKEKNLLKVSFILTKQ